MYQIKTPVHCSICHGVDGYVDVWVGNEHIRTCSYCGHSKVMAVMTIANSTEVLDPSNPLGEMSIESMPLPKVEIF